MTSSLFGSAPKASFSTQATILPEQRALLSQLEDSLTSAAGSTTPLADTSLAALEEQAMGVARGVTGAQSGINTQANTTLQGLLNYQAPDLGNMFQKGVVEPMTQNFNQRVLPGIAGKYGGAAGGAYGSDQAQARRQAGTDFTQTLAQQGALLSEAQQKADISSAALRSGSLGQVLGVSTLPTAQLGADIGLSTATFDPVQKILLDLIGASTAGTQQTVGVGTGGSSGLLGGLLGGLGSFAGSTGGSALIASLFSSDRRLKRDIKQVGNVDGIPLYRYEYKSNPGQKHIGVMAQDIEGRIPDAVVKDQEGMRYVNYNAVLTHLLEAA